MSPLITPIVSGLIYSANRRAVLEVFPPGLRQLWKDWDLRLAVLVSLIIQILLTILGNRRKYNGKVWLRALVWSAYTAADSVTIFALGIISNKLSDVLDDKGNAGRLDLNMELTAVWAQFLFFHLGGPDSITAYALEDNELWKRQFLGMVSQTCGAIYVFVLAFIGRSLRLSILSILMFIAGFIKYGERTWVLKAASNQLHRKSVLKNLSIQHIGFKVLKNVDADYNRDENKLLAAYGLLAGTRRLFVDASLLPIQSSVMKMVFKKLSAENAFQVNEIQLGMIYDLLYSKGLLLFSSKGLPLRVITFLITCFSFVFFLVFIDHKHKYSKIDLSITFALLIVAVLLEIYAALVLLTSDWFFVWLAKKGIKISKTLSSFPPFRIPRWSNNIGQYTLLKFFYKEKPLLSCAPFLGTEKYNEWNNQVDKELRDLIFRYFKERAVELQSMTKIKEMPFTKLPTTTNQEEKLQEEEDQLPPDIIEEAEGKLNSTTEFEYKIVIWSIATEIMYYLDKDNIAVLRPKCKAIKRIARYMLYILVKHPSMISAQTDVMNPSFEDIIKANFFRGVDGYVSKLSKTDIGHKLLERFHDKQHLTSVEGIVIYKAMKIVSKKEAAQEPQSLRKKWEEVGDFWLEMLAYSAIRCTVNNHAQKLRYGGEFLTHVWLLMAHFGLTHHHFQSPTIEGLKFITTQSQFIATKSQGLKFITTLNEYWNIVEKRFEELSTDCLLHYSKFGECIGMSDSKEFASELFRAVARKRKINGDNINKEQLHQFWNQIADENFDSRLKTFIDLVDKNADGKITVDDMQEIISLSAITNKLSNIHQRAQEYAALIMEELDPHKDGYIKVEKLENLLLQAPRKYERVFRKEFQPTLENNPLRRWYQKVKYYLLNVWQKVWILIVWLGILLGLFAYKFVQYQNKVVYGVMGNCVCIAKGAAETLKFNMALILLPVCRNTITWLKNETKLGGVVPFDNNLDFHMVIAVGVVIGVIVHSGAHLTCDFPRLIHATEEEYKPMKPYFGEKQPQNYWWFMKGVEGVTGIIMVVLMAIAFTLASPSFRRNRLNMPKPLNKLTGFNAFWYSHHLFVVVYVLLVVHGIYLYLTKAWYEKTTWMYLVVPILLYTCERLIRTFRSSFKTVNILKVVVYPENVLALHVTKPAGFKYESGQYMFINCPAVSPFEWHPFYITSAPGNDYLSLHIRTVGDWTYQLKTVFSNACQPPNASRSGLLREEGINISIPKIIIDGPYRAPAQDYKNYDVVLLIGLGIGATPMISIVQDIVNNKQTNENNLESALENGNYTATLRTFRTKKAYFYWVTREHHSCDWFKEIINEVTERDVRGVVELHNYCVSIYEEGSARSAMISVLQSLLYAKMGVDVVSETRVKSHFGRPNWYQDFENIASRHANTKIGVFYCGAPALTEELKQIALEVSENTSSEFEFHSEKF